ncbi:MAG TPA: AAA family ATPase [Mucilaginibacter sp.]|jgi:RecA-family ATPase|nr:AAA family ATPase [Mucilaginibacter sp.]
MNVTPQLGQNELDQKNNNLQRDENINPGFISAFEILNSAIPEQSFLIENILPAETICLLSGPSDTGKSILARQIAISVALGREDVAGFKLTCKYKKAMYISTEDGKRDWKSKLNKYSLSVEEQQLLKNLTLVFDIEHYSVKELEKRLKTNPVDVIVFDVFTDIFGKDLNNAIQVREFLADYKRLVKQYGCTIIFVVMCQNCC